jgi:uncharacterized protein
MEGKAHQSQRLHTSAFEKVRAIYDALALRPVIRNCIARTECCRFRLTGETPHLTKGEALLAAKAFRASGRRSLPAPGPDGACPLLSRGDGRCTIYEDRPFACRTHFCEQAGGSLDRSSVIDLIRRLEVIDEELGGSGGRKIEAALREALESGQRNKSRTGTRKTC